MREIHYKDINVTSEIDRRLVLIDDDGRYRFPIIVLDDDDVKKYAVGVGRSGIYQLIETMSEVLEQVIHHQNILACRKADESRSQWRGVKVPGGSVRQCWLSPELRSSLAFASGSLLNELPMELNSPSNKDDIYVTQAKKESDKGLSLEALLTRLEANAETGRIGERIALDHERQRIQALGCPDAIVAVRHVAPDRVDAGYDIESNWNGERRCIEVKSSTTDGVDFFISENERRKLSDLGSQAWLYRVFVRTDGSGEVVEELSDPIGQISEECFLPMVWRVRRNGS